jgi:O-antigen/teichoic acid export membrane protein
MENNQQLEMGKSAIKAGLWYTIGNIVLKGCTFISLPIFTHLLSTGDFGIYNTYIAYEQIFTAIFGLGFYGTIKNAKLDFKENFDKYLSSIVTFSTLIFGLFLIIANLCYPLYATMLGFSRLVTNCLFFQSFGAYLIYLYGVKLNAEFRYRSFLFMSSVNVLGNIVLSILLILFVFPNERYLGRILGAAIPLIAIGLILCLIIWKKGRHAFKREYWKYGLTIGIPLLPHVISQSLLSQVDRIMIKNIVGTSEAGIYGYIYTLCTILYIIGSSLENAWSPWVFYTLDSGDKKRIKKAGNDYVTGFALLTIGFFCIMPMVAKIMAGQDYWEGISLIIPLSLANYFVFLYGLPVNIEYYYKKTGFVSVGTILAAAFNVLLNYFAINLFGYQAAAYTTFFSYGMLFLFHWKIAKKYGVGDVYDINILISRTIIVLVVGIIVLLAKYIPFL